MAKYQQPQAPIVPQFKPLVQVDPSLLSSNRTPLQNPRPGEYLLNKTASTEGIASKKSLELKKRYLLGEPANGNKIQKSGSTSVLDSRIRSFQSNISECQKLLNPSSDISASMKTFLDRTKSGDKASQDLMRSATNNILNDLKVEITIQKASSTASTDNEKENVFVNSKNELNKCLEYTETVNSALLDTVTNKKSPTTPTNNKNIIETIDLVTPEKEIDRDKSDSNKIIDLTADSPDKSNRTIHANVTKPDVMQCIPDILGHIEENNENLASVSKDRVPELEDVNLHENNIEKTDAPEKLEDNYDNEVEDVQIEVPNIAWNIQKSDNLSSNTSCSSHSSSLEDIEHYILESTTSPETHNSAIAMVSSSSIGSHQVPRVEVHDSSGTLMQIDSLMIIDGKYIGDPEDLKFMEVPEGIIVPELPSSTIQEIDDNQHELDPDQEPVTATPEPMEATVIEVARVVETNAPTNFCSFKEPCDEQPPPLPENGPPLPEKGPPRVKPSNLKFDSKNENKIESLKNLPLIVDTTTVEHTKAVKPISLNLNSAQKPHDTNASQLLRSPSSPLVDMDKTPTGDLLSRGSDSETEPTGTTQNLTETELSDWTADDCISENFIDMDFVNKASTAKNRKRGRRKSASMSATRRLPSTNEIMQEVAKAAPVAEFEGILKSIDLDDIEFMDTGSDSSSTEPHSATNTALLRNRGYVEFVEQTTPKHVIAAATSKTVSASDAYKAQLHVKRDEKLGIDYIEQGAYILHDDANKTPVNESSQCIGTAQANTSSVMTQSLTDSSTINDIEDDSTNSQLQISSIGTTITATGASKGVNSATVTTEESDALTVVSSPLDSSSPHIRSLTSAQKHDFVGEQKAAEWASTPSSSDRAPKTSQSTSRSNSGTSSSKNTPPRQSSKDGCSNIPLAGDRRSNDELSYEEYVRALQQKIVQISTTARGDSLDAKKQRRKSSKGDLPSNAGGAFVNPNQTVIETTTPTNLRPDDTNDGETTSIQPQMGTKTVTTPTTSSQQQLNKVPEIPTLTRKLEEITKERTKQKDLIHDLVMDKLQSKKQLNAEKRLHRSRQRSILTSGVGGNPGGNGGCGYSSGSSLSPTPKLAAANSTTDANCTNQAHYHVSTAAVATSPSARTAAATQRFLSNTSSFKENSPSSSSVSTYGLRTLSPTSGSSTYRQRPFSENLEIEKLPTIEQGCKIIKAPSFSYAGRGASNTPASANEFPMPVAPVRQNRGRHASADTTEASHTEYTKESNFSTSTENLRSEARARARLKSNSELGLSPEEKMQLLRKRIQTEYSGSAKTNANEDLSDRTSDLRESKMSNSKSVNDLSYLTNSQKQNIGPTIDSVASNASAVKSDFTSDPNILLSSSNQSTNGASKFLKTSRRCRDPERRKSLIQSLSNFFHMGQHGKENSKSKDIATVCDGNSAPSEHPSTGCGGSGGNNSSSSTTTPMSGIDGVLSRFRISPKSKDKSRVS